MSKVNWIKIKNEYINTQTSYRKLADKYTVSLSAIRAKAEKENWVELKKKQQHKISTKAAQKTAEKIIAANVSYAEKIVAIGGKTIEAAEKAVGQLETMVVEGIAVETGVVSTQKLRQITQSLKDLKDIIAADEKTVEENNSAYGVVVLPEVMQGDE